ncbi:sn-glycerol-3-phosphate ABC transporter permease UgpE [Bosea thiooxidans]|nr:sn-glycerol-3-phosphate ABC transporter permease UgpE [Bosea sp. (in: a-proteobacteria)]
MVEDRRLGDLIAYVILTIGVAVVAFPVWLTFVASTWDASTVINGQMPLYPGPYFFENYNRILFIGTSSTTREPVMNMLLNSFIMAMAIALGKIFISVLSAYAVVYYRFPFRMAAFWIIFITLMLPVEVRIFPTFKIVSDLRMLDTYQGLAIPLIASATGTLLFRQFFMTIPDELLEASKIDGAGPFKFFKDTLLPLSITTIAALFVIQFIYGWNQYLWPLLVTTKDSMQTIVIAIKKMIVTADALTEWQLAMATAMLAMLPPVFVVIVMQRLFVKGLVETEK